ncbi:hypothetical protein TNCV_4428751 [Trichonephila clavipes]|nr:hypothetical protein TNCV_4428751 [Trichonephila clavipes]
MKSAFAAWGALNSRRAANPLLRLVERWESPNHLQSGGTEPNRSVICMELQANLRLTSGLQLASCHDEFRGP